jgi:hypothetical protein
LRPWCGFGIKKCAVFSGAALSRAAFVCLGHGSARPIMRGRESLCQLSLRCSPQLSYLASWQLPGLQQVKGRARLLTNVADLLGAPKNTQIFRFVWHVLYSFPCVIKLQLTFTTTRRFIPQAPSPPPGLA